MLRIVLPLVAALTAASSALAETTKIGNWELEMLDNKCTVSYQYQDQDDNNAKNFVGIQVDRKLISIVLAYQNWNFEKGKVKSVDFSVDGTAKQKAEFKAITENVMQIDWDYSDDLLGLLREGKQIVLGFNDGDAPFRLTGVRPAIAALMRCRNKG